MARRVEVTVDLGPGVPIEVVRQVIDNLDTVCQFGGELQYRAMIATAEWAILREPTRWIDASDYEDYVFRVNAWGGPIDIVGRRGPVVAIPAVILAPAVSRYLQENNATLDSITTVESIRYSNPIEVVLGIGIVALLVLTTVRDWPARRRLNAAVATDIENQVLARKELREELTRQIVQGNVPISAAQVDDLLTLDVSRAMSALGDSRLSMRELESGDDAPEHD
jgi:hypothetical protein